VISPEELAALDATYRPFAALKEWNFAIDSATWDATVSRLEARRAATTPETLADSIRRAMQAAAIDSGAIEGLYEDDRGFTISVLAEAAGWETGLGERDAETRDLIQAQFAGYQLALDAATRGTPISEALIRRIHEVVCAPQSTIRVLTPQGMQDRPFVSKGAYKDSPNHVRTAAGRLHAYSPIVDVPAEMHRLVDEIASSDFTASHPAAQAAYAHFALTHVHPFQDGNGRVARVLASIFLCRATSVPLVVFVPDKRDYFDALELADAGSPDAFTEFVFARAIRSIDLVADQLRPDAASRLAELRELATGHRGIPYADLDALANTILNETIAAFQREIDALTLPRGVTLRAIPAQSSNRREEQGYRSTVGNNVSYVAVHMASAPPATAQKQARAEVLVAKSKTNGMPFAVEIQTPWGSELLPLLLSEVSPAVTKELQLRLSTRARGVLGEMANLLAIDADANLKASGYV
jgi:Fic family protein